MELVLPTAELIEKLHEDIVTIYGGRHGILHRNVLETVIDRSKHYIQYEDCNIHKVCAVIVHTIAQNHPFTDANKRTALITMLLTYNFNGITLEYANAELNGEATSLLLWIVQEKPTIDEIAGQLEQIVGRHALSGLEKRLEKIKDLFEIRLGS